MPESIQYNKTFTDLDIGEQFYELPHTLGEPRNILTKVSPNAAVQRIGLPLTLVNPDQAVRSISTNFRATDTAPIQPMARQLVLDVARMVVLQCDQWFSGQSRRIGNGYFIKADDGYLRLYGPDTRRLKVGYLHLSEGSIGWRPV